MLNKFFQSAVITAALFLFAGCVASKKNHRARVLLQGIDTLKNLNLAIPEPTIKKGDLLTILFYSDNKEATELYNQPQGGGTGGAGSSAGGSGMASMGRGYLVDVNGQIYIQSIGKVTAEGMTRQQLASQLSDQIKTFLQNPYTVVRFTNNRITVLGEVSKPGVIELPDQKVSVLDALGFAGDLTQFARRDNILVVREQDGKRVVGRLDVRKPDIYSSPYFYLQQNDMVYVEPNRKKPTGNEQVLLRNITIATSLLSVVTLIITLVR